jgi:hypothetical protein
MYIFGNVKNKSENKRFLIFFLKNSNKDKAHPQTGHEGQQGE